MACGLALIAINNHGPWEIAIAVKAADSDAATTTQTILQFFTARIVDEFPAAGGESYVRLDLGTTWRPRPSLELAVWGQNLLDEAHLENIPTQDFTGRQPQIPRSIYFKISYRP